MEIKRKFKYILIFFIMSFSIFADRGSSNGIGDLRITVNLNPIGDTKLYPINEKAVLDTGIYNSNDSISNQSKIIAKVDVIMETKPGSNDNPEDNSKDFCTIDGEFNGVLKYKELEQAVESSRIELELKKYNKGNTATMSLTAQNYREGQTVIQNPSTDPMYMFTAYPDKCMSENMITRLAYSFDLVLEVNNFKNGDVVGGSVKIEAETGKGAIKDLIKQQIIEIMK